MLKWFRIRIRDRCNQLILRWNKEGEESLTCLSQMLKRYLTIFHHTKVVVKSQILCNASLYHARDAQSELLLKTRRVLNRSTVVLNVVFKTILFSVHP